MLWMRYEERVQIHTLTCGNPVAPAPFVEKTILSPLNGLDTLPENQLATNIWIYFWNLTSISLYVYPDDSTTMLTVLQ